MRGFVSFDLAGSAAFKSSPQAAFPEGPVRGNAVLSPLWLSFFLRLFTDIPEQVSRQLEAERERLSDISPFRLELWRITGDEVLFVTSRLREEAQLGLLAKVVYSVLHDMDIRLAQDPFAGASKELGLKATLWAAGFPIRNTEIELYPQSFPFLRHAGSLTASEDPARGRSSGFGQAEPHDSAGYHLREFLGPEIDLGFRLGGHACPRRLLISIDVAELIAVNVSRLDRQLRPNFHHVGWSVLKGLYGGRPYPLIWLDYGTSPADRRTSYEANQSPYLERYFSGTALIQPQQLVQLAEEYLQDTSDTRIKMYVEPAPTADHASRYETALGQRP